MDDEAYPDALPAGYRLHWYVLDRVLGQGGFGITYLARDTNLERDVAIKEYLPTEIARRRADTSLHARTQSEEARYVWGLERFLVEARTLARFDHPNIVRVHSVFEANNSAYMVMRFEEGANLAAVLEQGGPQNERQVTNWLLPILDGLQLVHGAGFIHRDIKPENIYIRTDGSPVLLDFGSARQSFGSSKTVTILVAPGYAPLEQYYGDASTQGAWTDIYSLGATCYRAIAGRPPYDAIVRAKGVLGSMREVLQPAADIGRGVFREQFLASIDHALQLSERDRPQDVAAWRRELVAADALASGVGDPVAPVEPAAAGPTQVAAAPADGGARRAWRRWGVGATIAAVGAVVGVAAVMAPAPKATSTAGGAGAATPAPAPAATAATAVAPPVVAALEPARAPAPAAVEAEPIRVARALPSIARGVDVPVARNAVRSEPKAASPPPVVPAPAKPVTLALARPAARTGEVLPAAPPAQAPGTPPAEPVDKPRDEISSALAARNRDIDAAEAAVQGGDVATAERLLDPWVRARVPRAQMLLGRVRETGAGQPPSPFEAYVLYSLAARGGEPSAKALQAHVGAKLQSAEIVQAQRQVDGLMSHATPAASAAR